MRQLLEKRKPVFTSEQIERLSSIFDNAGQVVFGVTVVSPLISKIDTADLIVILLGMLIAFLFWSTSVILAKKTKL